MKPRDNARLASSEEASRLFPGQSELSVAVASVFAAGCLFASLTAVILRPPHDWTGPQPILVASVTLGVALLLLYRGRRLTRATAVCALTGYAAFLVTAASMVGEFTRAVIAGLLIVAIIFVYAWFMAQWLTRTLGILILAAYSTVLLIRYPGSDALLIIVALWAMSAMFVEMFGPSKQRLKNLALTDQLCQVWNRAGFERILLHEIRTATRTGSPLSLLYLDLDDFKQVNDSEGHDVGDSLLAAVSQLLKENVRGSDVVSRVGGDEFIIILPSTTEDEASQLATRLRSRVTLRDWTFGVTEHRPGETMHDFIRRADQNMIRRKRQHPE